MGQQGSNTTFRVGGTARQAGGNWTGRFESPEGLNAWHSMYGNRVEPGDTVTVGNAILKWTGSAYKVIDGDFVDGPTASAWAAKFSPELASSSTATIAGAPNVYRGPGVGWVDVRVVPDGVMQVAVLGDSISAQYSSCAVQTAIALGEVITINSAVGGTKIESQAVKIPEILASGAKKVYIQVGTNNLGDSSDVLYGKYRALYIALISSGLSVVVVFIPPRSSAYGALIYKCNNAAYYAAVSLGIPTYDPWSQFALEAGGWSVGTIASDNVHPVPSARVIAATTLTTQIRNNAKAFPVVRTRSDSVISNACFAVDGNADGVADGWVTEVAGSPVFSIESDGSNGQKWQKITLTNPSSGDYGNIKQAISSGFSVGDTMVLRGNLRMDAADSVDDKCFASIQVRFLTAGSALISSVYANGALKQSIGTGNFECKFTVPPTTATIELVAGPYCWSAVTGTFVTRIGRVGLVNLTALAIP